MKLDHTPAWLGHFKGDDHSFLDCEVLLVRHVEAPTAAQLWTHARSGLIWFDYVRLHPVKAFYYFVHCYGNAYGRYLSRNINHELRFQRGTKGDPLESRELRQMLALKLEADRLGMPYPFFLETTFLEFAATGWTRPPRPSHLLKANLSDKVRERWLHEVSARVILATDPWFLVEHFENHDEQIRYQAHIAWSISLRERPHYALANAIYLDRHLPIEKAVSAFGAELIDQAQRFQLSAIRQQ